jgi:hypothetical protein
VKIDIAIVVPTSFTVTLPGVKVGVLLLNMYSAIVLPDARTTDDVTGVNEGVVGGKVAGKPVVLVI